MGLTDWLKIGKKKDGVDVKKIKTESVDMGAMAAGNQTGSSRALSRMMEQRTAPTKVLMVQDGEYVSSVSDYALKMAGRLGCDIISLDVTERPLQFSGDRRARESERFMELASANGKIFSKLAESQGIAVEHVVKIGNVDEVIAQLSTDDAGIRYVLSKPEADEASLQQDRVHVPVVDLHCSRL